MKFGKSFRESVIPEWRFYYMDYEGLKHTLKERTSEGSFFAEEDEATFVESLEKEIEKVFDFRDMKAGELTRHVQYCENAFKSSEGVDIVLEDLKKEIERITQELSDLSSFSRQNYTAFVKILKKHDKHTEFMLKPMFVMRLNPKMQQSESLELLIYRLSRLFDKIRRGPQIGSTSATVAQPVQEAHSFVRKTTKYWVHPDNVVEVKCAILRNLPVLVFPSSERKVDPAINSIYLDSDSFELYKGRIEKSEGAEAIRLRWYGSTDHPANVFVERKTHQEDWTGEVSIKERFSIKEKHLDEYLKGQFSPEEVVEKLRKHDGQSEEELEKVNRLAKEVQDRILISSLAPKLRTFYNRTAFQLPGNARVRISLDTELCMIKQDCSDLEHWKREDMNSTYPFSDMTSSQICRFPYAILEVKLQVEANQSIPDWITTLTEGPLVEAVPKFSKFIHGVATLFRDQVDIIPYWLPQMNTDIAHQRKSGSVQHQLQDNKVDSEKEQRYSYMSIPIWREADEDLGEETPLLKTQVPSLAVNEKRTTNKDLQDKRIAVPVRVEPKVYFANERTFLSWIHFSIFLGGVSGALVGLGNRQARVSGFLFAAVSILFTLYALYLYIWRAARIRQRDPGPYDDLVGPTMVVGVFLLVMIANMAFSLTTKQ